VGQFLLDVHLKGNLVEMFVVGILGAFVFLGFGFAIAGISRSEDQVAPLANMVAMPMILLGGVFFSRSNLPGVVHTVTQVFPLTYLADAMRAVAIDGASLDQVGTDLLGLVFWCLVACLVAIRFFRWE
jgi:ABC-2 type transport system permease protein